MKSISILMLLLFSSYALAYKAPTNKLLRIGYAQEFKTLHPLITASAYGAYALRMLNRGLFKLGPQGNIPQLVEKIPTLENKLARFEGQGDNKRLISTWTIRENAKWGDGTPVTANDILFAWKVANDPKVGTTRASEYQRVSKVILHKDNPKKFDFVHTHIEWNFNELDILALPSHLEKTIHKKDSAKYSANSLYTSNPTHPGLYNGPYRVDEFKRGSHLIIVRNDHFFGQPPKIEKILYRVIPHSGAIDSYLRSGTVDMAAIYALSIEQAVALEKRYQKEKVPLKMNHRPGIFSDGLYINLKSSIMSSKKVRQALRYSIKLDDISEGIFLGKQLAAKTFIPPSHHGYPKTGFKDYQYNLKKARQLLEEDGWKRGKDGIFAKNGKKFQLTFKTAAGKRDRERVQVYIKQQWSKLGIIANIKNEPIRVLYGESLRKRNFDVLLGATGFNNVSSPTELFHSKNIPNKSNNFSGTNYSHWTNSVVDKACEEFDKEFDGKRRKKLLQTIANELTRDLPWIPLYHLSDVSMTPQTLKGYKLLGNGYPPTEFIENWKIQ